MPRNDIKNRNVDHIDIVTDTLDKNNYKRDEDPKIFKSMKTSRGKLSENWQVFHDISSIIVEHAILGISETCDVCI